MNHEQHRVHLTQASGGASLQCSEVIGGIHSSPRDRRAFVTVLARVLGVGLVALMISSGAPALTPASAGEVEGGLPNLVGRWDVLKAKKQGKGRKAKYILSASPRLENIGEFPAGPSHMRFYVSTDLTLDESDPPLTVKFNGQEVPIGVDFPTLSPGESKRLDFHKIKLSKKDFVERLQGRYVLGVADWGEDVNESIEDDNVFPEPGDNVRPL